MELTHHHGGTVTDLSDARHSQYMHTHRHPSAAGYAGRLLKGACVLQVALPADVTDLEVIGKWGEELVNSFLCQWRDNGAPGRPTHILWCNQSGESGRPFDFKLTFESAGGPADEVYVEVKSTVKKEKSLIHMSANELDFALKEKHRYHIYRVYNAGDAQNVRLCRFQNLAQHLHTKSISLYLFL